MLEDGDTFRREDDRGRPVASDSLLVVCCDEFGDQAATCGDLSHEVDAGGAVTIEPRPRPAARKPTTRRPHGRGRIPE